MKTNGEQTLETAAIDAHRAEVGWSGFWSSNADAILTAAGGCPARRRRLVERLLCLVVSGDADGQRPVGEDAQASRLECDSDKPADTGTRVRCLLPLIPIPAPVRGNQPKAAK
jgi:hypothetical protein